MEAAAKEQKFQFLRGMVRDLSSMRTRAELGSIVTQAKREAWYLKMEGIRRREARRSGASVPLAVPKQD